MSYNPFKEAKAAKAASDAVEVDGTFACQFCYHSVDVAKFIPENQVLTWKCPDGHVSTIEGFNIFG